MISVFDLADLYKSIFGSRPYYVDPKDSEQPISEQIAYTIERSNQNKGKVHFTGKGIALNKFSSYGHDIWFPVEFWKSTERILEIKACTVRVDMVKTLIRTSVSERKGQVIEQFNIDNNKFTIQRFLIGENRTFPEDQILALKEIFETTEPISLHGGYPELFLDDSCQIVMPTLTWPEVQAKAPWIKPFSLTCESDSIRDLIIE